MKLTKDEVMEIFDTTSEARISDQILKDINTKIEELEEKNKTQEKALMELILEVKKSYGNFSDKTENMRIAHNLFIDKVLERLQIIEDNVNRDLNAFLKKHGEKTV